MPVVTGVEVLLAGHLNPLRDARVGLVTNHTGIDRRGTSALDRLDAAGVRLSALFAPEHGFRGTERPGDAPAPAVHSRLRVPIYPLYGETRAPTARMLAKVDVLMYDIQDVGSRAYTYWMTMVLSARAAIAAGKRFIVLDRPNPVRADRSEGGLPEAGLKSDALPAIPLRYGLTQGELAQFLIASGQLGGDVTVIPMRGYTRRMWWSDTGLPWVNPSPNIRDADAALLYCGIVLFEGTNMSVGRGTNVPFKAVGAPWLDAVAVAKALREMRLPGVEFEATVRPVEWGSTFGGTRIPMVLVSVTDRDAVEPVRLGVQMLRAIHALHRDGLRWAHDALDWLSGSSRLRRDVESGETDATLARWATDCEQFAQAVEPSRLYER